MRYYSRLVKKYAPGQMVFSENSECDGMYIIDSGRVRVFKSIDAGKNRREVELCTLGPRAMFGEMAMIDENRRSASVQAIEQTVCTVITRKIFEDQLSRIPSWMVNMIRILVSRLRETNDKLRMLVEEYTTVPADAGGLLTIDADSGRCLMPGGPDECPAPDQGEDDADAVHEQRPNSRTIIEDLYDDT